MYTNGAAVYIGSWDGVAQGARLELGAVARTSDRGVETQRASVPAERTPGSAFHTLDDAGDLAQLRLASLHALVTLIYPACTHVSAIPLTPGEAEPNA